MSMYHILKQFRGADHENEIESRITVGNKYCVKLESKLVLDINNRVQMRLIEINTNLLLKN